MRRRAALSPAFQAGHKDDLVSHLTWQCLKTLTADCTDEDVDIVVEEGVGFAEPSVEVRVQAIVMRPDDFQKLLEDTSKAGYANGVTHGISQERGRITARIIETLTGVK